MIGNPPLYPGQYLKASSPPQKTPSNRTSYFFSKESALNDTYDQLLSYLDGKNLFKCRTINKTAKQFIDDKIFCKKNINATIILNTPFEIEKFIEYLQNTSNHLFFSKIKDLTLYICLCDMMGGAVFQHLALYVSLMYKDIPPSLSARFERLINELEKTQIKISKLELAAVRAEDIQYLGNKDKLKIDVLQLGIISDIELEECMTILYKNKLGFNKLIFHSNNRDVVDSFFNDKKDDLGYTIWFR